MLKPLNLDSKKLNLKTQMKYIQILRLYCWNNLKTMQTNLNGKLFSLI